MYSNVPDTVNLVGFRHICDSFKIKIKLLLLLDLNFLAPVFNCFLLFYSFKKHSSVINIFIDRKQTLFAMMPLLKIFGKLFLYLLLSTQRFIKVRGIGSKA